MTFGDLLDHYFDARKGRLQETTLALYRRTINQHVRPKIGNVRLDKLTREHVERVLDNARDCSTRKRKGQPLCGRTKRNILIRVRSVLAWGSKNYEGVRNIARNVEPPLIEDREDVAFDGERVRKLLKAAKGTEIEAAVIAAIGTGLRRGELCALRWCDIDLDKAVLRVRQSAALLDGRIITKAPKTKGSRRDVSMPDFVVTALRAASRATGRAPPTPRHWEPGCRRGRVRPVRRLALEPERALASVLASCPAQEVARNTVPRSTPRIRVTGIRRRRPIEDGERAARAFRD